MNLVILKVYLSNKTILKNLQSKIRYISIKLPIICFMQVNLSHHSYNQVTFLSLFETDFLCRFIAIYAIKVTKPDLMLTGLIQTTLNTVGWH